MRAKKSGPEWLGKSSRALGIVRVSSSGQKDNTSPETQREGVLAYARDNNLELVDVIQIEESAKDSKARKKFHAAIERLADEKIRHVIFFVWDRTTRNFTDHEILEALIRSDDIVLHVANDRWMLSVDSDEGDWMKAEISTFVAKSYSRTLSRRAKQGQDAKAAAGWYPTRPPPGYRNKRDVHVDGSVKDRGGTVEQHPGGRALLHRMHELRMKEQLSLSAIAKRVVDEGLWSAAGRRRKTVNAGHIQRLLTDPFYVGRFVWRDKEYVGKHQPMFTEQEWNELQATFGKTAPYGARAAYDAAFAGWMTCEECGCRITAEVHKKKSGRVFIYYRCANGRGAHTKLARLTQPAVEQQLERAVDAVFITDVFADLVAGQLNVSTVEIRERRQREQAQFRKELEATQANEDELTDKLLKRVIDDDTYQRQLTRIRQRRAVLLNKIEETHAALDEKLLKTALHALDLAKKAKDLWAVQNLTEKRAFLDKLVLNPRMNGASVRFDLRKPFDTLSEMRGDEGWRTRRDSNSRPSGSKPDALSS
jgi:site-specific DNA recombinase